VEGKLFARGQERLAVRGVTYGPFAPTGDGEPFPSPLAMAEDFSRMRAAGLNAVRTYHLPPDRLFDAAAAQGVSVFVDVPWPRHVCFLDSAEVRREARSLVRKAAERGRSHPALFARSIGNEIPASIVRWHGARRVERFLAELADVARQADPDGLVTYASYPSTEYLDLAFLDFVTFNVYLHDPTAFRRYLFRLQNLVGDQPLVLGELGMDTLRHGEPEQARHLARQVREAGLMGLAGTFVFSWTDDWHTGGHPIEDWAFGITRADRSPKASYHALRAAFTEVPAAPPAGMPRISVVVCAYNAEATLEQCLRSLSALRYPDYEVIVVDDGSTDGTRALLERFPEVRSLHQPNRGLSVARNEGLRIATGAIVAYTDADCYAEPEWLTCLAWQLQQSGAAAVGGPNLTPEDGRLAACVAAAPGQPTHVLESDQVAEHIPGCNMAFRREVLLAINGFDPAYHKAGDDVDVCWRLQQAGHWITFAPGAFVWHHRRQSPCAYLRQQAGYGEAEALLRFKHRDRFNGRGESKWRGVLYGAAARGLRLSGEVVYRGTFGTGLFQCLYRPAPAHWAMLPGTLEWHAAAALAAVAAVFWPPAWAGVAAMLVLALAVAGLQAAQARLAPRHDGPLSRLVVAALCWAQPLVRSGSRYRTRLFGERSPLALPPTGLPPRPFPWSGRCTAAYWNERGQGRLALLRQVIHHLDAHRWGKTLDSGWSAWDLEIHCHRWTVVQAVTAEEDHGGGKRLIRVRYRLRPGGSLAAAGAVVSLAGALAACLRLWPAAAVSAGLLATALLLWWRGTRAAERAAAIFDRAAADLEADPEPGAEP